MKETSRKNNYDRVAPVYDLMARVVFGNAINRAQLDLLGFPVSAGSRILIVGGGTGMLIEELAKLNSEPFTIVFVEISENMIHRARKRNPGIHKVNFICSDISDFKSDSSFDVIITPFLFDNFTDIKARDVFTQLDRMLHSRGIWMFVDFHISPESYWWQKRLLKMMYRFFKVFAFVEAKQLPDIDSLFDTAGYVPKQKRFYYRNFIQSVVYYKSKLID